MRLNQQIPVLSKGAFGHTGKDEHHVVISLLLVSVIQRQDVQTVRHEVPFEEPVHDQHLEDDIDEAQRFAKPIAEGVHVVLLQIYIQPISSLSSSSSSSSSMKHHE